MNCQFFRPRVDEKLIFETKKSIKVDKIDAVGIILMGAPVN